MILPRRLVTPTKTASNASLIDADHGLNWFLIRKYRPTLSLTPTFSLVPMDNQFIGCCCKETGTEAPHHVMVPFFCTPLEHVMVALTRSNVNPALVFEYMYQPI
jgi:hypothetical protein